MSDRQRGDNANYRLNRATPFVGRAQELSLLRAEFRAVLGGESRVVLIGGEPGIGKTRLIERFLDSNDSSSADIVWGQCVEWDGSPAYWPWLQAFEQLLDGLDAPELRLRTGNGAGRIAQFLPFLSDRIEATPPSSGLDPEQARFELFNAVAGLLRRSTLAHPVALVIDDLHWADPPSLALLRFLASSLRDSRLMLLAAYRQSDAGRESPLAGTLASLVREPGHVRVALQGLGKSDVREFVAETSGDDPDDAVVDAVYRAAGGNPLFTHELVRLRGSQQSGNQPADLLLIPETVRDVVRQRVNRLSRGCIGQLEIASAIGREFSLPVLARVAEVPVGQILEGIDEAKAAGLIEAVRPHVYRFTHALVQDTVYDDIASSRIPELHGHIASALERQSAGETASLAADLARHFGLAAPAGFAQKAIHYSIQAANVACSRHAWESEIHHYNQALSALAWLESPDPVQRCDILLALGDAQARAGKGRESAILIGGAPEASQTFLEAAAIARSITDPAYLAHAVLGFTGPDLGVPHSGQHGLNLVDEALSALPETDSEIRAKLLARSAVDTARLWGIGALIVEASALDEVHQRSNDAVAMARRLDHPALLAYTLEARYQTRDGLGLRDPDDPDTEEMLQLAMITGDAEIDEWGQRQCHASALQRGEITAADRALYRLAEVQSRRRSLRFDQWLIQYRTGRALRRGELDVAERLLHETLSLWPQSAVTMYQRATLRWEQDRIDEAMKLIETRVNTFPRHPLARSIRITLWLELGDVTRAKAELHAMTADNFADVPRGLFWTGALSWLARGVYLLDEPEFAGRIYELLLPYRDRNLFAMISDQSGGSVYYYLGLLATTMKRWELASRHFQEAHDRNQRWEIWPYVAHTRYAWAEMLSRRGEPAGVERAIELTQEALDAATQMRMHRLARLSRGLQEQLSQTMENCRVSEPTGLSSREIEVLRLIAEGLSDRAISERLFISPRTVGSHVSNILTKLNVSTRAEAAVVAVRRGIV